MKTAQDILSSKVTIDNEFGLESSLPHILEAMEEYAKQYKQQRNLLNEKISNLLIAIEKGYVTVFPENDLTPDYIQDLEDAQKQITKQSVFTRA